QATHNLADLRPIRHPCPRSGACEAGKRGLSLPAAPPPAHPAAPECPPTGEMDMHRRLHLTTSLVLALVLAAPLAAHAQSQTQQEQARQRAIAERMRELREAAARDPDRAAALYVSNRPEDHSTGRDFERDIRAKARTDSIYAAVTTGVVDYGKVSYRSRIGDLDIPAYVYQPLERRGPRGHAAIIFVHGGVHSNWTQNYWPFVKEAVERGYVVVAPDYRGSTGYGKEFHDAIDYGGYEIDDVVSAYDWITANLPHVDPERVAIMGWS